MRIIASFLLLASLCSCGSVLDPAPYAPSKDQAVLATLPSTTSSTIMLFADLADAERKLQALGDGYAGHRDDLLRQQLLFDIPMMGLAVATVASGIYGAEKSVILGLGLGTAGVGGARLYFAPQTRALAYNNASSSLLCGSTVAGEMKQIRIAQHHASTTTRSDLVKHIGYAGTLIKATGKGAPSEADKAALLAARDKAQRSLSGLQSAIDLLDSAPVKLRSFAQIIIKGTTDKVMSGTQNLDKVLELIKATPTSVPPAPTPPAVPAAGARAPAAPPLPSVADTLQQLAELSEKADQLAKVVTTAWESLVTCALPK